MLREQPVNPTAKRSLGKLGGKTPLVVFLVLALAIGTVGYSIFARLEESIRQNKYHDLSAVGDLKVSQIVGWFDERRSNATATTRDPILTQEVQRWLQRGAPHDKVARRIESRLQGLREAYSYDKVILLDRGGRPALVAGDALHQHAHAESNQRAVEAMGAGQPRLSDLHLESETDGAPAQANIDLYAPLLEDGRRVVATVYFQIDPYRFLFPFIQSWPTPSGSAETLLVRRDGDDVLYLNELRHRKDSALRFRLPLNSADLPAAKSLRGETGVIEGVDYRGVPVLAALRTIPGTSWHLVAKIDQAEVFAPARDLAIGAGAMVAVLIASTGLLVISWWRRQHAQFLAMRFEEQLERQALVQQFDYLSRHANDIILLMSEDHRIVEANDTAVKAYGFPREQLLQMSSRDLRASEAPASFDEDIVRLPALGSLRYETEHKRRDGSVFPIDTSVQVIEVEGKRYLQAIIRDVSGRKSSELALRESEATYHSLFDNMLNGFAYCRMLFENGQPRDFIYLSVNPAFETLTGLKNVVGRKVTEVIPSIRKNDPKLFEIYGRVAMTGQPERIEYYVQAMQMWFWISVYSPKREHFVAVFDVITERKSQELRISRLNRTLAVLSGINSAIVRIHDRQELFEEACRIAVEHGNFGLAWVSEFDPVTLDVTPVAYGGTDTGEFVGSKTTARADLPLGQGIVGRAIRAKDLVFVNDLTTEPDVGSAKRREAIRLGYRSAIALPLLVEGAVFGTLSLYAKEPDFFDEHELKLLRELAGDISFALEHIAVQEKFEKLSRIRAVSSGINAAIVRIRDRQALFEETCHIASEQGKFEMVWIGTIDSAKQEVRPAAWTGFSDEAAHAVSWASISAARGTMGEAIQTRRPALRNDIEEQVGGGHLRLEALKKGCRSTVCLPLVVDDRVGALVALFAVGRGFFDEDELALLEEMASDVSFALDHIAKAERLDYLAYYDALTGLPNRALFVDRTNQRMRARGSERRMVALILVDLERFRNINETLGRHVGNDLLRQVAARLKGAIEETDVLAHIGGDHFAIATRRAEQGEDIVHILDQTLTSVLSQPFEVGSNQLRIAARTGVAAYPTDGADAEVLLKNAEAALRDAKKTGRRYQFYAPEMNARVAEQLKLENDLRNALLQEQYVLHYQPRFDLVSGAIVGLEALIRWKHPERGIVPPGEFVPVLEETEMIIEVGSWALKRAALDHAAWSEAGLQPPRIAVNVSPVQLRRKDFADYVKNALATVDKAVDRIDIEITESMLMEDIGGSIEKLKAVQSWGLQVALDDFGTGYSSLSYLARLPIDLLKIDRSFITQMPKGAEQLAIVSAVISLARALNLKVVAEGVETEEQANLLRLLRCDEVQGYLFGKPMPPEQIAALLAKR